MVLDRTYKAGRDKPRKAQTLGLGTASNIVEATAGKHKDYPTGIAGMLEAPKQYDYFDLTEYKPLQQLTGGDFGKLQEALAAPIERAGEQQQARIEQQFGGRGLYGSVGGGLQSGAAAAQAGETQSQLGRAYANAFALQQKENQAQFAANQALADQRNLYEKERLGFQITQDEAARAFRNQQIAQQHQDELAALRFGLAQEQTDFERATQLSGLGTSGYGIQAQQDIARESADAAQRAALTGGLVDFGAGLIGTLGTAGGDESLFARAGSGIADWLNI